MEHHPRIVRGGSGGVRVTGTRLCTTSDTPIENAVTAWLDRHRGAVLDAQRQGAEDAVSEWMLNNDTEARFRFRIAVEDAVREWLNEHPDTVLDAIRQGAADAVREARPVNADPSGDAESAAGPSPVDKTAAAIVRVLSRPENATGMTQRDLFRALAKHGPTNLEAAMNRLQDPRRAAVELRRGDRCNSIWVRLQEPGPI
jgi:hypothetical protein